MGRGRGKGGDECDDCCEAMCEEGGIAGVACVVITVVAVILISVSFGNIDVQEVGLFYNGISVTLNRAELIPNASPLRNPCSMHLRGFCMIVL